MFPVVFDVQLSGWQVGQGWFFCIPMISRSSEMGFIRFGLRSIVKWVVCSWYPSGHCAVFMLEFNVFDGQMCRVNLCHFQ